MTQNHFASRTVLQIKPADHGFFMPNDSSPDSLKTPRGLLISRDLFFSSRISGTAKAAGWQFFTVMTKEAVERSAGDAPLALVMVDLDWRDVSLTELVALIKHTAPHTRIIGFGPHVHAELLQAAREAGFNEVLTNGQLSAQLQTFFANQG